jgi:hypothetical protein
MYLNCCFRLGVSANNLFTVNDLYEKKDLNAVVNSFFLLSKRVELLKLHSGPFLKIDGSLVTAEQVTHLQATRSRSCSNQYESSPVPSLVERKGPVVRPKQQLSPRGITNNPEAGLLARTPNPEVVPKIQKVSADSQKESTSSVQIVVTPESPAAPKTPPASRSPPELPQAISPMQFERMSIFRIFHPAYWISCVVSVLDLVRYTVLRG